MEEKKVAIGGVEVNYKVEGEGRPVLILHGWGGSSDSWLKVQEILAGKGFRVLSLDLPGFGKSSDPSHSWNIDDYISLLLKFVEKTGLENFSLVGHSFGGGLAIKLAADHPELVEKLAITGAAVFRSPKRLNWRQRTSLFLARSGALLKGIPLADKTVYPFVRRFVYRFAGVSDYQKANEVMRATFRRVNGEDLGKYLPSIKKPVFVIWGGRDRTTPPADAFAIQKAIPGSWIKVIEGSGHSPHLSHPELLAGLLAGFIAKRQE
ncbi:MAG: alpha/beta hydrolase [Candidatus Paceibacterota bacterium]|jgi:pimeloyl-ACP methyl ester carboxylesterase